MKKRLTVKGSTLRSRSLPYKEKLVSEVRNPIMLLPVKNTKYSKCNLNLAYMYIHMYLLP